MDEDNAPITAAEVLDRLRTIGDYPESLLLAGSLGETVDIRAAVERVLWQQAELATICALIVSRMDFDNPA